MEWWRAVAEFVHDWDWSAIAAFIAVGATLWVARAAIRDRRQQIRQEAMVELNHRLSAWLPAAIEYLDLMDAYSRSRPRSGKEDLDIAAGTFAEANGGLDRALKSVHMTNTDYRIGSHLSAAEAHFVDLMNLFRAEGAPTSLREETAALRRVVDNGRPLIEAIEKFIEPVILRGFRIHRLRHTFWFWLRVRFATVKLWVAEQTGR